MKIKKILQITKYFSLTLFIAMTISIWVFSLIPGNVSAEQSNTVGSIINELFPAETPRLVELLHIECEEVNYYIEDSFKLNVTYLPQNADAPALIWYSSNPYAIEVSNTGEVDFLNTGSAIITAKYAENDEINAQIELFCLGEAQDIDNSITAISIISDKDIPLNYYVELMAVSFHSGVSVTSIWSVENEEVATIVDNAYIVGISEGTSTLTAQYGELQTSVVVTVSQDNSIGLATAIELGAENDQMPVYSQLVINAAITPISAPDNQILPFIVWESENVDIATVNNGIVYAKSPGSVKIYAKWLVDNTVCDYFEVVVNTVLPDTLYLNISNSTMSKGQRRLLHSQYSNNPYDTRVTYTSDNEKVLTVNQNGLVTAKSNGTATITAVSLADENVFATITIIVKPSAMFNLQVRKIFGHFGLFFILSIFGAIAFLLFFKNKWIGLLVTMLSGFVAAGIAELFQLPFFTTGRYATFADVGINFLGYFCGTIITLICIFVAVKIYNKKQASNIKKD